MPKLSANFQATTFWRTQALFDFHCFSGLWHLLIFLCFISYSGSDIFVLSNLFFVLDSTGSIFNRYLLCFTFLLQLEADEALNLVGSEHNNVDFELYEVSELFEVCVNIKLFGRSSTEKVWLCQHQDHQQVKNGRTDDVMWEFGLGDVKRGEKEEEVREAEEKQVDIFMATFVPLLTFVEIVAI